MAKNKTYFLVNIIGLTAGLVCFAFIALWVSDELSYDTFNRNYNRIVRVTGIEKTQTGISESAVSSAPMAKALKDDYAEVENTVRLRMREEIVTHNNQQVLQPGILLTDPSFFDVFSYHLTRGNVQTALSEPYSIVLTESTAKKYFGDSNPIGQTLLINMYDTAYGAPYKITAVMPDPPTNAHFTFSMLASFKTVETFNPDVLTIDGWGDAGFYTYLLLKRGVDYKTFSGKIAQFYKKYVGDRYDIWKNIYFYKLQPLRDIHLKSNLQYEIAATGNQAQVYIFSTIGIFILLLAGINYMNLATAHSVNKAKEAGIRKVAGAERKQLIFQYLLEAILIALTALVLAIALCSFLQPAFFQLTGKNLSPLSSPFLIAFLVGVAVMLGILSGIYPAFVISGFKPIAVLKGSFKSGSKGVFLRRSLVVSQFVITILLISSIIVIYAQMTFIKNKDLGYDKNGLLFLRVHGNTDVINGYTAFKNELLSNPLISGAAISNTLLGSLPSGGSETVDEKGNLLQVSTARIRVDADYLDVYGIKLSAGRNFDKKLTGDSIRPVILNEAAIKKFGWKDAATAIGKPFKMGDQQGKVIAIANDFNFSTLQQLISPLAIYPLEGRFSRITLKTSSTQPTAVIAWVERVWKRHFASALFDYDFSDNVFEQQYRDEKRFARIVLYFSVLSLLIACLGLYGLIAYTTSQKTKEIGIRKVLGASANGIALLLSKDFLRLVVLAFVVATPVAWLLMNKWLQDFAYRTRLAWWMFAAAGLIVLLIALLTVSFKAIKAATANPVKSLRTE